MRTKTIIQQARPQHRPACTYPELIEKRRFTVDASIRQMELIWTGKGIGAKLEP